MNGWSKRGRCVCACTHSGMLPSHKRRESCHLQQHGWASRAHANCNKSDKDRQCDLICMWNLKNGAHRYGEQTGVAGGGGGQSGRGAQKAQTSSYRSSQPRDRTPHAGNTDRCARHIREVLREQTSKVLITGEKREPRVGTDGDVDLLW